MVYLLFALIMVILADMLSVKPRLSLITSSLLTRSMGIFYPWKQRRDRQHKLNYKGRLKEINPEDELKLPRFVFASAKPMTRVYTWGMAAYGALGVPEYLRPIEKKTYKGDPKKPLTTMHRPARCGLAEKRGVSDVACGYGFTVFALAKDKRFHLLCSGLNKDGQLGYVSVKGDDNPLEMIIRPMGITLPVRDADKSKVVKVAAGSAHTLALTNDGDIFSLGEFNMYTSSYLALQMYD